MMHHVSSLKVYHIILHGMQRSSAMQTSECSPVQFPDTHPGSDAPAQVHPACGQRSEPQVARLSANDGQKQIHRLHRQGIAPIQSSLGDGGRVLQSAHAAPP